MFFIEFLLKNKRYFIRGIIILLCFIIGNMIFRHYFYNPERLKKDIQTKIKENKETIKEIEKKVEKSVEKIKEEHKVIETQRSIVSETYEQSVERRKTRAESVGFKRKEN